MPANTQIRVANLNFAGIKSDLKQFLKTKKEFTDYDFEASTISTVLDLLAYNTYRHSFYLNMLANEMYLDSSILRESAVSRAKEVGYFPRSAKSAVATLYVSCVPNDSPTEIVIPKRYKVYHDN